jgi:hypothetical protein
MHPPVTAVAGITSVSTRHQKGDPVRDDSLKTTGEIGQWVVLAVG